MLPNGSRLSCGRNAHGRKAVEEQIKRLAGEGTQFFPHAPPASRACQAARVCHYLPEKALMSKHTDAGRPSEREKPTTSYCLLAR